MAKASAEEILQKSDKQEIRFHDRMYQRVTSS